MTSAGSLLRRSRRAAGLTQAELARRMKVTQPVVARLERKGANPRLSTLDRAIAATGHALELRAAEPSGIDESMIASDLRLSPDDRLRAFESLYRFAREFGGAALRGP